MTETSRKMIVNRTTAALMLRLVLLLGIANSKLIVHSWMYASLLFIQCIDLLYLVCVTCSMYKARVFNQKFAQVDLHQS